MKNNVAKISFILVGLLIILYIVYKFGFSQYLTLENLKAHSTYLYSWVSEHYLISVVIYMAIYFLVIAASLPSTAPMSIIGGFLFGTLPAVLYATVAATLGATLAFLLFRNISRATIEKKYADHLVKFKSGLNEHGAAYLLLLHFMFIVPFFVINMLAAVADVSLWKFVWTTAVGFLPCAFVYAFSGKRLFSIRSISDVFSWEIIIALILLIAVVVMPIVIKKYKKSVST
ncbi:TVP38/TMEM64 family protein [Candidatus Dependentiae bacterium]